MSRVSASGDLDAVKLDAQKRVIPKGSQVVARWWRVSIGKRWTGSVKKRRFFRTQKEAKEFIEEAKAARGRRGHSAFQICPRLAMEAMEVRDRLAPYGASLTDAAKAYLKYVARGPAKTLNELLPEYLRTKTNPEYRRAQKISLGLFARKFGINLIPAVTSTTVESWLDAQHWKPLNRNNYRRDLSMFFNWAKRHGHITENPVDMVPKRKVIRSEPDIYTAEEAGRLLNAAVEHKQLELLGMYALGLFAGIRTREISRMTWSMIDWREREIRLSPRVTKTGQPRNIPVSNALISWLGPKLPTSGTIVRPANLRLRKKQLHDLAGVTIKRNALRHSFASYHAAKFRNPAKLQFLMGQRTPDVLWNHYIAAVRRADAVAFFDLRPKPFKPRTPRRITDTPPVELDIAAV